MKGFKDSTRTQSGHTFSRPSGWFSGHGDMVPRGIGGVDQHVDSRKPGGNALVHREVPTTEEQRAAGGHDALQSGFKKGGEVHKHFHVHHHEGGKTRTKSYRNVEKHAEHRAEGGHVIDETSPEKAEHGDYGDYAKGGKIHIKAKNRGALHRDMGIPQGKKIPKSAIRTKLARDKADHNVKGERRDLFALNFGKKQAGGAVYAKGGKVNRLAVGGAPNVGALGAAAARALENRRAAAMRASRRPRTMLPPSAMPTPIGRARGGGVEGTARKVARQEVSRHVKAPAPQGHRGLGRMIRKG